MVRLGLKPGAAGWKVHTNPLSYGGTPNSVKFAVHFYFQFVSKSFHRFSSICAKQTAHSG